MTSSAPLTPLGIAALKLAGKGLRVFPCIERSKKPAIDDNLRRATTDPNLITGWWQARDFNIGIATGPNSGIWVLDIDDDDGEALLRRLEIEHQEVLAPTVEAITGKGRHLYFRWPAERSDHVGHRCSRSRRLCARAAKRASERQALCLVSRFR